MGTHRNSLSDAQLDALVRNLDPLGEMRSDAPLNDREQATLMRIMSRQVPRSTASAARPRQVAPRNVSLLLSMAVATVVAVVAIVLVWPPAAPRATALTPPPLKLSSSSESVGEVVGMAQNLLADADANPDVDGGGAPVAQRKAASVGWYLQMDHLASGETSTVIAPHVVDLTWNEDGSGREIITAGVPYLADGSALSEQDSAPEPGTVLSDITYPAGGFETPIDGVPGTGPDDVRRLLAAYWNPVDTSSTASDVITAVGNAFGSWTLTDQQHAHILDMLSRAPGAFVAGTAVDRANRDVTVIAADSTHNPDFRLLLLISNQTGRIVGTESVRLTAAGELPAGAVTSYTLWDTD